MPPSMGDLEDRSYRALIAREVQYERQVAAALRESLDAIRSEMEKIYRKYADSDGLLTKAEMTRYNRYASMEKQLMGYMDEGAKSALKTIDRLRPEQYEESFFRYAWSVDNSQGVRLSWGVLNRDAILETIASELYRISVDRYGFAARAGLRQALANGLSIGKSYPKMIGDIKKHFDVMNWQAMRILRTEGQTAINAGRDDSYTRAEEKGIEGKRIWNSTLDDRTREDHRSMDGVERGEDGLYHLPDGSRAPYPGYEGLPAKERINCRCRDRFEVAGFSPQIRRSREQGIIPYQTYDEWKKTYKK